MVTINTNLKNKASTQFMNYGFNSFCNFNGKLLAAKDNGLFSLEGDSDHGSDIDAQVETVLHDWGGRQVKRPRKALVSYRSDGELELSIIDADLNSADVKTVPKESGSLPQNAKFTFPRTVAHTFWKFKFTNVEGSNFKINALEVMFTVRPHGLSQST